MNLLELKEQINGMIESINDYPEEERDSIEDITVSIQIDGLGQNSVYTSDFELKYDNNGNISGCVIFGYAEDDQ